MDGATDPFRRPVFVDRRSGRLFADPLIGNGKWFEVWPSGAPFTQIGPGAITRTVKSKLRDVVSVKDFGAVGNGVTDDTAAIQAALDVGAGIQIHFPKGTYKITSSLNLKSGNMLTGDGREFTRIQASGNYPILQHVGTSLTTIGDVTIRSLQIRGQAYTNNKQFGVFCDWGGSWLIEDCSFRLCKIGYFQGTSRNNVIRNCDFIACDTAIWMGPIDQSGGGTPDNTIFMDTIDAADTVTTGLRVEGATGLKAVNCSFVEGVNGINIGNYIQATTPRAILDGATTNVPAEANARNIRWLHLTNVFCDSNSGKAIIIDKAYTGITTKDVRLVNCYVGNSNDDSEAVSISSVDNLTIVGTMVQSSEGSAYTIGSCTGVLLSAIHLDDWDLLDAGLPGIYLTGCLNSSINSVYGDCPGSTAAATNYLISLNACNDTIISQVVSDNSKLVLIGDSVRTDVSNSRTSNAGAPVVETGTSNDTGVTGVTAGAGPTLIGANSYLANTGTASARRSTLVGGSAAAPAVYLDTASNTGWYRSSTYGIGYSHNGTVGLQLFTDTGNSNKLALLPGEVATNNLGVSSRRWKNVYADSYQLGNTGAMGIFYGSGTPEAAVTANVGSLYLNTTGGAGTTLYVKQSGTGNTGWVAK